MAYYAIYCRGGYEEKIESIIKRFIPKTLKEKIIGIICPMATTQTIRETGVKRNVKRVSFNYIYLKVDHQENSIIPSEIYHFLKELPFVQKVFKNDIPKEEVNRFCKIVGSSLEESEIEIVTKAEPEQKDDMLTKINEIRDPKRIKEAERQLNHQHQNCLVENLKQLLSRVKNSQVTITKTSRYNKVRLPLSLLVKAVEHTKVDVNTLRKPTHFLKTLQRYFTDVVSTTQTE